MKSVFQASRLLSNSEVSALEQEASKNWVKPRDSLWISKHQIHRKEANIITKTGEKIIETMSLALGKEIKSHYGLEFWININKQQGLHCDCDETLRQKAGIMRYPVCSSVFYLKAPIQGGELVIYEQAPHEKINQIYTSKIKNGSLGASMIIKPQRNQLVIFGPKMPHYVRPWETQEERISIAANLWTDKPANPNKPFEKLLKNL